jgi:hypothetical protein
MLDAVFTPWEIPVLDLTNMCVVARMTATETEAETDSAVVGEDVYTDGTLVRDPEIEQSLSQEEYDPKGTLALLLVYFLILVLMWTYMYFVEFLGNGATVVG